MKPSISLFALLAVSALSTACGHSDSSTAARTDAQATAGVAQQPAARVAVSGRSPLPDACTLFTLADAEGVLGTAAVLAEHARDDAHATHCQYNAADQAKGFNSLMVEIHSNEDVAEATTGMAITRALYSNDSAGSVYRYEALTGIGDDAFMATNKVPEGVPPQMVEMLPDMQLLYLIKGARNVQLTASYSGKARPADNLRALALKIANQV